MLTAKAADSDGVEALLVLEDIKGLEYLREQQSKLATYGEQEAVPSYNTWKFVCDESPEFAYESPPFIE